MANYYDFSVIKFSPRDIRSETLNVGIIVFRPDRIDVRLAKKIEKVRVIDPDIRVGAVSEIINRIPELDKWLGAVEGGPQERLEHLSKMTLLEFSAIGQFVASTEDEYESRILVLMRALVDTKPTAKQSASKRSRLLTVLRGEFRKNRVLADPSEGLESHRIVSDFPIDNGLNADLALKNGSYHFIETVEERDALEAPNKLVADLAVSTVVLRRARMNFGESTKVRLVYRASADVENYAMAALEVAREQGAQLINLASEIERHRFVQEMSMLAVPAPPKTRIKVESFAAPKLLN